MKLMSTYRREFVRALAALRRTEREIGAGDWDAQRTAYAAECADVLLKTFNRVAARVITQDPV